MVGPLRSRPDFDALVDRGRIDIDVEDLLRNDPDACIPAFGAIGDPAVFARLQEHPALGVVRPDFSLRAIRELDATTDGKKRFFTGSPDDHPVHNHTHVGVLEFDGRKPFNHVRFDEVVSHLQALRGRTWTRSDSAFLGMPEEWVREPATHPVLHPRMVIRDVVHASNRQKVWAAVAPARTVLTNSAPYLHFRRGTPLAQAYLLGMVNSAPVNWFGHMRVGLHLSFFILSSIPVPELDPESPRHQRIAELAARLSLPSLGDAPGQWAAFGPSIEERGARLDALCEIHALALLAYGLSVSDLPVVLRWFPEQQPLVASHYDRWASA